MEVLAAILTLFAKIFPKELYMITRKSFFIRWLLLSSVDDEGRHEERSVIDIEHIQSGSSRRVSSLEEASQWMRDAKQEREEDRDIETE